MNLILSLLLISSVLLGDLLVTPKRLLLENSEPAYGLYNYGDGTQEYGIERFFYLSTDVNGVGWFFPKYLSHGTIGYKARYLGRTIDPYIFASSSIDICPTNIVTDLGIPNTTPYNLTTLELLKLKETKKIKYISPREMFSLNLEGHDPEQGNFWFFAYPKTKKDYINKDGGIYPYKEPIICSYAYYFNKNDVDNFVINNSSSISSSIKNRCNDPWTYLNTSTVDKKLSAISPYLKENDIKIKYSKDFNSDFDKLYEYILEINSYSENSNSLAFQREANALKLEMEAALKKKDTTSNLCLYINYLSTFPEYKIQTLTIKNSCPCKGTLGELHHNIKYGYNQGYKFLGKIIKDGQYLYVKDKTNNFYKISASNGCNLYSNKVSDRKELEELQTFGTTIGDFVDIHDWDNDANLYYDCLIVQNNTAYKFDEVIVTESNSNFIFKPLKYEIIRGNQAFVFNTQKLSSITTPLMFEVKGIPSTSILQEKECEDRYTSEEDEEKLALSNNPSTPIPTTSTTFQQSSSSQIFENDNSYMPSQSTIVAEENEIDIPIENINNSSSTPYSSSQTSSSQTSYMVSSSSSISTSSKKCEIANILNAKKTIPINGYFAYYGSGDPYDWIYLSKTGKLFAKLEGMNSDGTLDWLILNDYFSNISFDGENIVIGETTSYPQDSKTQEIIKKLEKKTIPINGYFAYYGSGDPYDWIYLSKTGKLFAKLEGMNSDGTLDWLILSEVIQVSLEDQNIIIKKVECK